MPDKDKLITAIKNTTTQVTAATYVTSQRGYTRYYIQHTPTPHNTVIYQDEQTGKLLSSPKVFEATLKSRRRKS